MVHLIERREYNFHCVEIEDTLLYTWWQPTYNDHFYDHTVAFAAADNVDNAFNNVCGHCSIEHTCFTA